VQSDLIPGDPAKGCGEPTAPLLCLLSIYSLQGSLLLSFISKLELTTTVLLPHIDQDKDQNCHLGNRNDWKYKGCLLSQLSNQGRISIDYQHNFGHAEKFLMKKLGQNSCG
jgi:hypothetical protein